MRIIGGSAKRRALKSVSADHGVRPILARIRKSLFDILRPQLEGSVFVDLFAGTGTVGIEALSRGAAFVTFVEKNPICVRVIHHNLSELGFAGRARVIQSDVRKPLARVGQAADIIFMGPPYHDENWNALTLTQPTLENIAQSEILKPEGIVIGQHHAKEPAVVSAQWDLFRQENYGDSRLSFFRLKPAVPEA